MYLDRLKIQLNDPENTHDEEERKKIIRTIAPSQFTMLKSANEKQASTAML